MGITISIMNQKGGVGKTTLTVHLGVGLAALGYNVAMVDMDPQGHLSVSFDMPSADGIFQMLVNERPLDSVLKPIDPIQLDGITEGDSGSLTVLPGGQRTQLAAIDIQLKGSDFGALSRALEPLAATNDFILIDTSPTVALFTPAIIQASDYILIPTEMSRLSFDGVNKIIQNMINLEGLHSAEVAGIIPMMARENTREHLERLAELHDAYPGIVWGDTTVSLSTIWKEATDAAMTVYKYAPGHKAVDQAWKVCTRVLNTVLEPA